MHACVCVYRWWGFYSELSWQEIIPTCLPAILLGSSLTLISACFASGLLFLKPESWKKFITTVKISPCGDCCLIQFHSPQSYNHACFMCAVMCTYKCKAATRNILRSQFCVCVLYIGALEDFQQFGHIWCKFYSELLKTSKRFSLLRLALWPFIFRPMKWAISYEWDV